jgi:prophage regulatory protein
MLSRSFAPDSAHRPGADDSMPTFLRMHDVMRVTGLARSTLYRMMAEQCFPAPCRLGLRAVGWRSDDIAQWSRSRPAARDDAPPVHAGGVR